MEQIKTKGFTAKDLFNASGATPVKAIKGSIISVSDVLVTENSEGETVGYMKTDKGEIYATISTTVIDQLVPLIDIIEEEGSQKIKVIGKTSSSDREYYMLELQ